MNKKFSYCPICGLELKLISAGDETNLPYCDNCQKPYFDNVGVCIIAAVINEYDEICLLEQKYVSDMKVLVAGHINFNESLETACIREVYEETGQTVNNLQYINSYAYGKKDLLMVGYECNVIKSAFNESKEVDAIGWFPLSEAPSYLREGSVARSLVEKIIENKRGTYNGRHQEN